MVKLFGKIKHILGVEGTEPEGFKKRVRSDACKLLLGIVVRGIKHEGQNLQITFGDSGAVMFEGFQEG